MSLPVCPECGGSGHDQTKFCPATAWVEDWMRGEGRKPLANEVKCHPCPACGGSGTAERWTPTMSATAAWRTFPSDYELALLDTWLQGLIGTDRDYEARLALNVLEQRRWLADELRGEGGV